MKMLKFTYRNTDTDDIILVTLARTIFEADKAFLEATGQDVTKMPHVGIAFEELNVGDQA